MKLIDLLVDIFDVWPEGVAEVMQDWDGEVKGSAEWGSYHDDADVWVRPFGVGKSFGRHPVAEDAATTLVTEKEWTLEAVLRGKKVIPTPQKSEAELLWDRVHSGEQSLSDGVWKFTKKDDGDITFLVVVDGVIFPFTMNFGTGPAGWKIIREFIINDRNYAAYEPSELPAEGCLELIELFEQEMETKWMVYVPDCEGCYGGPFLYPDEESRGPSVFKSEEDAEKAIQDMVLRQGFKREDYHIISFNVPKIRGK